MPASAGRGGPTISPDGAIFLVCMRAKKSRVAGRNPESGAAEKRSWTRPLCASARDCCRTAGDAARRCDRSRQIKRWTPIRQWHTYSDLEVDGPT